MCFYFAQALTDELAASASSASASSSASSSASRSAAAVPIGLIASSVGGTMIESWSPNSTLDECPGAARGPGNAQLYNGMVSVWVCV